MSNYTQCPYRREGLYVKDSWQRYNACVLYGDAWSYYDCEYGSAYCKFKGHEEELIKVKEERDKQNKIKSLTVELKDKQRQIEKLEQEVDDILKELDKYI